MQVGRESKTDTKREIEKEPEMQTKFSQRKDENVKRIQMVCL